MPDPLLKLQNACNALLQEDPHTLAAVKELAGRIVCIEISGPELTVFVQFNDQGIVLMHHIPGNADVTIRAGIPTYLGLLFSRDATVTRRTPNMSISGDVTLAQQFQQIMKELEIDWEEQASHWVGDTAAHKLGRMARDSRRYLREAGQTLVMDVSEYLRYEKELLPERTEIEEFINAVDQLRNDADRLGQRIDRLKIRLSKKG